MFVEVMLKKQYMKLSKTEEELMNHIWKLEKAFMKNILNSYPEPKPAPTTVATLLKRMTDKGFIAYKLFGNTREYYPLVKKKDYFSKQINGLIKNFFNNSPAHFASFLTELRVVEEDGLEDADAPETSE